MRLLLCTDLDRTLIPNGHAPESAGARDAFAAAVERPGVRLVYVSGRGIARVLEAIEEFDLPHPEFAITDVGSKIFALGDSAPAEVSAWTDQIDADWGTVTRDDIEAALRSLPALEPQPADHQRRHKCSFFLPIGFDPEATRRAVTKTLAPLEIRTRCICSVDPIDEVGLLDVLPESASKLHALRFLQREHDYSDAETVFAGDSGNDLEVLTSSVPSVLVANAGDDVRTDAMRGAAAEGYADRLYLARGDFPGMNGNYAAGVLEGCAWFGHDLQERSQEAS